LGSCFTIFLKRGWCVIHLPRFAFAERVVLRGNETGIILYFDYRGLIN
jgi:hypothetical protein